MWGAPPGQLTLGTTLLYLSLVCFPRLPGCCVPPAFPDFLSSGLRVFPYRVFQAGRLNYKRHYLREKTETLGVSRPGYL